MRTINDLPLAVRMALREYNIACRCDEAYTTRDLVAPDCQFHDFVDFLADLFAPDPEPVHDTNTLVDRDATDEEIEAFMAYLEDFG